MTESVRPRQSFVDDKWSRNKAVTSLSFHPTQPELFLAACPDPCLTVKPTPQPVGRAAWDPKPYGWWGSASPTPILVGGLQLPHPFPFLDTPFFWSKKCTEGIFPCAALRWGGRSASWVEGSSTSSYRPSCTAHYAVVVLHHQRNDGALQSHTQHTAERLWSVPPPLMFRVATFLPVLFACH